MAFPTGWSSKHKITIDNTKVSGSANLTDFPVYLSGDNFLPDVFTKAAARREINANWLLNDANLQGYWRLEADGTDSSPNGYNLAGTTRGAVAGKFGNGLDFERDSSDYISIADASCPNLEISGSQTWSVWIKPESLPSVGTFTVMGKRSNFGSSKAVQISYGADRKPAFRVLGLSTSFVVSDTVMSVGNWYHIVGRYDSTAGTLSVFVNGAKNSVATSGSKNDTDGDFVIGGQAESGEYFDGIIDDVAIFNRALSDYEVKALYYGTADLRFSSDISGSTELASEVVFFDPDNSLAEVHVKVPTVSYNTDTDFYVWYEASSEAPYAYTATYGRNAVWSDLKYVSSMQGSSEDSTGARTTTDTNISYSTSYGKSGQGALLTRASSSKIAMSNLGISGTTAITISGWIYTTDNDNQPFYNQGVWDSNTAFSFYKHYTKPGLGVSCGATRDVGCTVTVNNNTWYHVACVYPGSGSMMNIKFYLNGVEQTTESWGAGSGNNPNMADSNYNFGGNEYNGRIDSVRVGNIARSSDWIATEYANQNSPSTFAVASYVDIDSEILSETHGIEDIANEIQSQISGAEYRAIKGGYRILIKDRDDNFLGEIDNFRRLEFGKRHNNYGTCQFEMPVNDDKADLIELRKNKIEIYWQENGDMTRVWAGELANRTGKLDNAGNNWDVISGFTWLEQLNSRFTRSVQLYRDKDQGDILWDLIYSTQFPYIAFNKFYPTGNGTDSENMPVVGVSSAYLAVNTLDDDTYIANEEDGNYISLFTTDFSFIPVGATINSVKVYARIETLTVDYGDNEIAILVDSNYHGSGDLGISNNQPFTTYSYTWTQNPETSLDWEVSDLVGFEFGVNLSFARCSLIYVEVDFETTDSDKFDLGFTKGSIEVTTNRDRTYNNQNIMEAFINMSNVISGCDFEITDDKVLNVYLLKGEDKTQDIILEYGENVSDVQIDENFVHPVNKAIVLGQSTEVTDSLLRVERNDTNLQDEYKVREGLMSEMDVSETSTLQEKGDALIRKQGEPLIKLDLTMVKGSEINPTMFDLGDLVRVVIKDGHYNIDEEFRIYEWNVGFDDNDASQLSLVLGKFIVDIS